MSRTDRPVADDLSDCWSAADMSMYQICIRN